MRVVPRLEILLLGEPIHHVSSLSSDHLVFHSMIDGYIQLYTNARLCSRSCHTGFHLATASSVPKISLARQAAR